MAGFFGWDWVPAADDKRMVYNLYHEIIFTDVHYYVPEISIDTGNGFLKIIDQHIKGIAESFIFCKIQFYGVYKLNYFISKCFGPDEHAAKVFFKIGQRPGLVFMAFNKSPAFWKRGLIIAVNKKYITIVKGIFYGVRIANGNFFIVPERLKIL